MRKKFWAVGGVALLLGGCTATQPAASGWQPSKDEFVNTVGNTVMHALHQYQQYMQRMQDSKPQLKPSDLGNRNFPDRPRT